MSLRKMIRVADRVAKYGTSNALDAAVLAELDRVGWTEDDLNRVLAFVQREPGRLSDLAKRVAAMTDAELMAVVERRGEA